MENPTFTALEELGLLCIGEPIPATGDTEDGEHTYRGHVQFSRFENDLFRHPFLDQNEKLYRFFEPGMSLEEAFSFTNVIVMLGATNSKALQKSLENPNTVVLIFEPDAEELATFLSSVKVNRLAGQRGFFFLGDPYTFSPALQDLMPSRFFRQGTPAVFQTERIAKTYPQWAEQTVEYIEILHFRHAIYPLASQQILQSRPLRNIKRERTFAEQLHSYDNIPDFVIAPDIRQLRNRFDGQPAILVAAGPTLPEKFDYIRNNRNKAVVIAVNNAIKPLAEAGIKPHFTVINDTSLASGAVFKTIPKHPGTILVGHCLADLGGDRFHQKYLFESHLENIFPERPELDLHGSVITTAFSLARLMGCSRCALVGAQLASHDPWKLAYARGTTNYSPDEQERPLTNAYPQLYPVQTPQGKTLYTTPNFRDAALWMAEEIRLSGIPCYNTTEDSILFGRGITFEGEPKLDGDSPNAVLRDLLNPDRPRFRINTKLVFSHIAQERANWTTLHHMAESLLQDDVPTLIVKGSIILKQLDESGATHMLEGYPEFRNVHFHTPAFHGTLPQQAKAYRYFFQHFKDMCDDLINALDNAEAACWDLQRL